MRAAVVAAAAVLGIGGPALGVGGFAWDVLVTPAPELPATLSRETCHVLFDGHCRVAPEELVSVPDDGQLDAAAAEPDSPSDQPFDPGTPTANRFEGGEPGPGAPGLIPIIATPASVKIKMAERPKTPPAPPSAARADRDGSLRPRVSAGGGQPGAGSEGEVLNPSAPSTPPMAGPVDVTGRTGVEDIDNLMDALRSAGLIGTLRPTVEPNTPGLVLVTLPATMAPVGTPAPARDAQSGGARRRVAHAPVRTAAAVPGRVVPVAAPARPLAPGAQTP
ncbi:MAG TPA: hypothetical protein VEY95_01390 [Azospirillaceae bacterium]|nr:hypothetical protein [Azospirillaceae bacterium]